MVRPTPSIRQVVATSALVASLAMVPAAAAAQTARPDTGALASSAALLPAWDGSIDLYRDGVFTTQKSWLWCTAAGVQIVRNISV